MQFDTSYLNKTPNKTARNTTSFKPEFVILHETAGYGSLEWNLRPEVRSSYNYLIGMLEYAVGHAAIAAAKSMYTRLELRLRDQMMVRRSLLPKPKPWLN